MARWTRLELATPCVTGRYSNQLNYHSAVSIQLFSNWAPGDALLSHGETPHYHRRNCVSLLSSAWDQVEPQRYGRQTNSLLSALAGNSNLGNLTSLQSVLKHHSSVRGVRKKPLGCCMVKPHGQLVQVSSMPRSTYTPCLSTS